MTNSKHRSWDKLKQLGARLQRPHAELPRKRHTDLVGRLFGELTHFCFVVELDGKGARARRRP
jgi:hypothetical protein